MLNQFAYHLARLSILHDCAKRHLEHAVIPSPTILVTAFAGSTVLGLPTGLEMISAKVAHIFVG